MASAVKPLIYSKPSMTDLPYELGKDIIEQIMSSPKPDFSDTRIEVEEIHRKIMEERKKHG